MDYLLLHPSIFEGAFEHVVTVIFPHRPPADSNQGKLKQLLVKYGKAGLLVWVVVSILVLFACYTAIELGVDTV